ncbi:hypothetical protein QVM63_34675, partial [Pseudomonas aeruginosa]
AALGDLLEMPQVSRDMPGHLAIPPDNSIGSAGEDKDDFWMIHISRLADFYLSIQAGDVAYFSSGTRFCLAIEMHIGRRVT